MSGTRYPQFCALARAAEILGERWTLLIIRELMIGQRRFSDLADRLSGVSPTVLTNRLTALVESGVVGRATLPAPYNAQVYELTTVGRALKPTIHELIRWGGHFLFPMRPDDEFEPEWVLLALDAVARRTPGPARKVTLRVKHKAKSGTFLVESGEHGTRLSLSDSPGSATIETRFDALLRIIAGALPLDQAIAEGLARVEGSLQVARTLPRMFDVRRQAN
jgi:DNA-binding HxlR family transcriptional regulator